MKNPVGSGEGQDGHRETAVQKSRIVAEVIESTTATPVTRWDSGS
jgi:hypothetical protein